jgi:hypothetical protein
VAEPSAGPSTPKPHGRLRRFGANLALVLACLVLVFALLATWTQQVVLNTNRFMDVVGPVPTDPAVQASIADFVSTQVVTTLDLQDRVANVLPPKGAFLAAPITSALQQRLSNLVLTTVSSERFAQIWDSALRSLHEELVRVLRGQSTVITIDQGVLYLNVLPLVGQVVTELQNEGFIPASVTLPDFSGTDPGPIQQKLSETFGITIPPTFGQIPLVESAALTKAQTAVKLLDVLVIVLWLLVIGLMALAIWATSRRRRMVLMLALGSIVALLLFRVILRGVENWLVSNVADPGSAATVQALTDAVLDNLFSLMWWFVLLAAAVALVTLFGGRARTAARSAAETASQRSRTAATSASAATAASAATGEAPVEAASSLPATPSAPAPAPAKPSVVARAWIRAHLAELRWIVPGIAVGLIAAIAVGLVTVVLVVAVVLVIEYALTGIAREDDPSTEPAEDPSPTPA